MKMFSLLVGAAGVLVVSGFPVHLTVAPSLLAGWHAISAPAAALATLPNRAAQWSECGSLLLLATGMFGASILIGRGRS